MTKKQIEQFSSDNKIDVVTAELYLKHYHGELTGKEELPTMTQDKLAMLGNPFLRASSPFKQIVKKFATFGDEGGRQ